MSFRNAFLLSIIIHIILLGIFFKYEIPQIKSSGSRQLPLIARIITPEIDKKKPHRKAPERKTLPSETRRLRPEKKAIRKTLKTKEQLPHEKKKIPLLPQEGTRELKKSDEQVSVSERKGVQELSSAEGIKEHAQNKEVIEDKKVPTIPTGRELLGRDLIAKAIRKEAEKERKRKGSITFESKELKYYSYMLKLKQRIESIWAYPEEAARRGIFGDLYIEFTIRKDGSLGAVRLLRTSGYPDLDEAAMRALKDGQPYWPLPEHWGVDAITIKGHFIYTLYGMYIR